MACISGDPAAESCVTCSETNCSPAFHDATGFDVDCQYVDGCNGGQTATQ
jgi:hypothetical protein